MLQSNRHIPAYTTAAPLSTRKKPYILLYTLYLQLLEMQKAFTSTDTTSGTFPASNEIRELQTEYPNIFTAIIDLLDDAKYLWEGESHEQ